MSAQAWIWGLQRTEGLPGRVNDIWKPTQNATKPTFPLCHRLKEPNCARSVTAAWIALSTLMLACSWKPLAQFILLSNNQTVIELSCSALFRLIRVHSAVLNNKNRTFTSLCPSSMAACCPCPAHGSVTSLLQPTEMEFDSDCSWPESPRVCIKKASQQCWQEYIYRDCVSFQQAARGGAGCWKAIWSPYHLHWMSRTRLALQTEPRTREIRWVLLFIYFYHQAQSSCSGK